MRWARWQRGVAGPGQAQGSPNAAAVAGGAGQSQLAERTVRLRPACPRSHKPRPAPSHIIKFVHTKNEILVIKKGRRKHL